MDELLIQNARAFASQHRLQLAERLGYGIHGIVLVLKNNAQRGKTAVKLHRNKEPFRREWAIYERLREAGVSEILGFNVPQLIRVDEKLGELENLDIHLIDVSPRNLAFLDP